jgi:hypothetical protein
LKAGAPSIGLARAGVELGKTRPHPIIDYEAVRERAGAQSLRKRSRELSARRHPLYTFANPVIVIAVVKTFGG